MSATTKKIDAIVQAVATADDEWEQHISDPGLQAKWAGPCEPIQSIFKRLKVEHGANISFLQVYSLSKDQAQSDYIEALKNFRDKSCPTFLVFFGGVLVKMIRGADSPLIEKVIKDQLELEKIGGTHKPEFLPAESSVYAPLISEKSVAALIIQDVVQESQELIGEVDPPLSLTATETMAIIKPDAMVPSTVEAILEQIRLKRFVVGRMKRIWMSRVNIQEIFKDEVEQPFFQSLATFFTSGPCLALILSKDNSVDDFKRTIGPLDCNRDTDRAPKSLRAYFGTDNQISEVIGSQSQEKADRDIESVFGPESLMKELEFNVSEYSIKYSPGVQKTLCVIKSEEVSVREAIIERIICCGLEITQRVEIQFDVQHIEDMFPELSTELDYAEYLDHWTKSSYLALVLKRENVVNIWRELSGPEDPSVAREKYPESFRALFGKDKIQNGVHASISPESAIHEINAVFPRALERGGSVFIRDSRIGTSSNPFPANYHLSKQEIHSKLERTVALIKPDAFANGRKDAIIEEILQDGFTIIMQTDVQFSLSQAQEFYKEHQTKPFYDNLISWMSGTPIYAMLLEKERAIGSWMELVGPSNPVKAKEIAPRRYHTRIYISLRALYGTDVSHNGLHASDSPASAEREVKVIFGDSVSAYPDPLPGTEATKEVYRASLVSRQGSALNVQTDHRSSKVELELVKVESVLNIILGTEGEQEGKRPSSSKNSSGKSSAKGQSKDFKSRTSIKGSGSKLSTLALSRRSQSKL